MRIIKTSVLAILLLTATVVLADQIKTDHDRSANFTKYKTFTWVHEPRPKNPLMKDRIVEAINTQLEAKGLSLVTGNADLGLSANVATQERHTLQTFYDDFPGWGWHHRFWGFGPDYATTTVETYTVGTLVVDLFDTQNKQVVWWSSASDTVSSEPEKNVKKLDKVVEKMFKDFPPKGERTTR